MKVLRYFAFLLFIFSIFNCTSISTKSPQFIDGDKDIKNYDLWYRDCEWLMLKQEKDEWKLLKTEQVRKNFVEKFYEARDPDRFTFKNEFQIAYQRDLEKVRKDYTNFNDPRRYVYLRFGEPGLRRVFTDQVIIIPDPYTVRIHAGRGEIWQYSFGSQNFQVIFATLSPQQLQQLRDRPTEEVSPFSLCSSGYEILYIGSRNFPDIIEFLESFLQENFRLQATSDTINDLKKPILERAEEFYKKSQPKVRKKQYPHNWEEGLEPLITQFDINLPEEVGISVWLTFDKDSLYYNSKEARYRADISLYCEVKDSDNKRFIHYQDDDISYKLKEKQSYYYHFWGSLPSGDYTLILEVGESISGKKYKREIKISDYSASPALKTNIWIGRAIKEARRVKEKSGYFSLPPKEGAFCPAATCERFYDYDKLVVIFNISGFQKNHYGISYVETSLSFVEGKIENHNFVSIKEVFRYHFPPLEENESRFQSWLKIDVGDFIRKAELSPGLHLFRIKLSIRDIVANQEYSLEYSRTIRVLGTVNKNNLNNLNSIRKSN